MTTVFDHLELYAGQIQGGRKTDADGNVVPIQIVFTEGGPYPGTLTFSTLGLSNFPLKSADSEYYVRHELVMILPAHTVPKNVMGIIQQAGLHALARRQAYSRGDVIRPYGKMFEGFEATALYVAPPAYFPEEFASVHATGVGEVIFAWLVSIFDDEMDYIATHGWPEFEQRFDRANLDMAELSRPSVLDTK